MTPPHKNKTYQDRAKYDEEDSSKRMRITEKYWQ